MQTFVENKFVLMRVFVQTTCMKMFADVRGPLKFTFNTQNLGVSCTVYFNTGNYIHDNL